MNAISSIPNDIAPTVSPASACASIPELVDAAAKGSSTACAALIDLSRNTVCSIALAVVKDVPASEDIAQEVYVAAWKNLATLRNAKSFLPWIRQLTRNHCIEHLRRRARHDKRHLSRDRADEILASVVDPAAIPAEALLRAEERRIVAEAVDQLPEDARDVVILFYREGRSAAQVAALLDVREDAVKKRLSRARAQLREALLEQAGALFERTAPGAAFSAAILGVLTVGAPATATAAGMSAAKSIGSASTIAKIAALLGGPVLGAASGAVGISLGVQKLMKRARDDEERAALRRFRSVNIALVVVTSIGWIVGPYVSYGAAAAIVPYAGFIAGLSITYGFWLPKIISRREAAELEEDPQASRRQRQERIRSLLSLLIGIILGGAGLYFGLKGAGRLP